MIETKKSTSKPFYFHDTNVDSIGTVSFNLSNVDTSLANSIRRTILSEIPTYGFEDEADKTFHHLLDIGLSLPESVKVLKNTSPLHNEFLSHRVGLIPVHSTRKVTSEFNETLMQRLYFPYVDTEEIKKLESQIEKLDETTEDGKNKILEIRKKIDFILRPPLFKLNVTNNKKTRKRLEDGTYFQGHGRDVEKFSIRKDEALDITSDMFVVENVDVDEHDYILPDPTILEKFGEKSYPLIIRLKSTSDESDTDGQSVNIMARPTVGIAKLHSKYCPVGTVTYEFVRDDDSERIRTVFMNMMFNINKNRKMKGVKEINIDDIFDGDNNMVSENREVKKYWNSFQILDRDKIYLLDENRQPQYYKFSVEGLGSMEPVEVVYWAMYVLRLKLIDVVTHIDTDYVKVDKANAVMDAIDIEITNENHTIGNIIANHIKSRKDVKFSTYKMPHPLDEIIILRIQLEKDTSSPLSYKDRVINVFQEEVNRIIDELSKMMMEWRSQTNKYLPASKTIGYDDYIVENTTTNYFETKKHKEISGGASIKKTSTKNSKKVKVRML